MLLIVQAWAIAIELQGVCILIGLGNTFTCSLVNKCMNSNYS